MHITYACLAIALATTVGSGCSHAAHGEPHDASASTEKGAGIESSETGAGGEWKEALEHARSAVEKSRREALEEIESALQQLKPQIDALRAQTLQAVGAAKAQWQALVDDLESEQGVLRTKLADLRSRGSSAWERVLEETRDAAAALAARCERALEERRAVKPSANVEGGGS